MIIEDQVYARMVYGKLKDDFDIEHVIIDNGESYSKLLRRRIKNLGVIHVIGQVLFRIVLIPYIRFSAKARIDSILRKDNLKDIKIEKEKLTTVPSINSEEGQNLLKKLNPDIVVIVTHRILSKKTLKLTKARFINIHAGITPLYRGLHGGYWALINNDTEHCGVTVHLVDEGIDTGGILYQDTIVDVLSSKDNFISYIYLQLVKALPLLKKALQDAQNNSIEVQKPKCPMGKVLYYQPTFWFYLYNRLINKIK